jgi:hypothetical protein
MAEYFSNFDPLVMGARKPRLSVGQILAWADVYHAATGRWPSMESGKIHGSVFGTTWAAVNLALKRGARGLPGGTSLSRLLDEHRRVRRPDLTLELIRGWAREHCAATGQWPRISSGAVTGADGETWCRIDRALRRGHRGLPSGLSLAQLLGCGRRRPPKTIRARSAGNGE